MLRETLAQIRRTPYQALSAVMVIFLTFFASAFFVLVSFGSVKVLEYFEQAPQVIAFFEKGEDLTELNIASIRSKLDSTGKLSSFKYVSTKEAEAIYKERNKDNPLLLELVDYKILPPSIEITATKLEDLAMLRDNLAEEEGVTDIVFFEDIVKNLNDWIQKIKIFGTGVLLFLALQSILIIFVIINMKLVSRKDEIEVLRLLGASKWFVKRPFLLEGMIYGVTGALMAFAISYGIVLYSTEIIIEWLREIPLLPLPGKFLMQFLAGQVLGGALIGFVGSYIASARFIHD